MVRSSNPEEYGEKLSIGDVAAILGVHPGTAARYAREGVINARKLPTSNRPYVLKSELMAWLKAQPVVSYEPVFTGALTGSWQKFSGHGGLR